MRTRAWVTASSSTSPTVIVEDDEGLEGFRDGAAQQQCDLLLRADGQDVELAFAPGRMSYRTVRERLFTVSGGEIPEVRRLGPPSNLRYEVTVRPSGNGAVTLARAALPACGESDTICTADGRALEGPPALTVPGPARLSVEDATVEEGPGAELVFAVTLDRERHVAVTVSYATSDGSATAGQGYTAASGTLTFEAGETAKSVSVVVLDDTHVEGLETFTLSLSNATGARIADGEAVGTIENPESETEARFSRRTDVVQAHADLQRRGVHEHSVVLEPQCAVALRRPGGSAVAWRRRTHDDVRYRLRHGAPGGRSAMAESFFATLECELLDRTTRPTHAEARAAVFEFIEGWYNTRWRHSALGYRSPLAFERLHEAGSVDGARPVDALRATTSPLDPALRTGSTPPTEVDAVDVHITP